MKKFINKVVSIMLICSFILTSFVYIIPKVNAETSYYAVLTGDAVNIRSGPGTNYKSLGMGNSGATFDLLQLEKVANQGGCGDNWYKIRYNNQEGYVCSSFTKVFSKVVEENKTPTNNCETELNAAGFPSTYWGALCLLKAQHPTWKFVAKDTTVDFSTAVLTESLNGRNRIANKPSYYYQQYDGVTYNAGGYYTTATSVIAYYLDPRNFLNDVNVFMFEASTYNTTITDEQYINALKQTYGNRYFVQQIPDLPQYILNSSKALQVNPLLIATRNMNEIGQGKSNSGPYAGTLQSALTGNYSFRFGLVDGNNYNNYYNFFNVGAYDSCAGDITRCAMNYAFSRGWGIPQQGAWNTEPSNEEKAAGRQESINKGTNFMKTHYIDNGQNTLYTFKFNVTPTNASSRFANQYMTNIQAPSTESSTLYNAYKNLNMLESAFIFYIPIYRNMPAVTKLPTSEADKNYTGESTPVEPTPTLTPQPDQPTEEKPVITVDNIIATAGLKRNGNTLYGIELGTSIDNLKNKLESVGSSVTINGTGVVKTGTTVTIKASNTETLTLVIRGDASGDGVINALDLLVIQKHILGVSVKQGAQLSALDANQDGKVNALDLLVVQKHILGVKGITQ